MRGDGNDRDGRESGSTDGAREAKTRRDVEDGHNPGTARGGGRSSADASTTVDEGERERGSVKRFPPRNSESEEAGAGTTETSGGGGREPRGTGTSRRAASEPTTTTRERRTRRGVEKAVKSSPEGAVALVEAWKEGAAAGLALCGNVYVNSVEQKLPDGVRGVVKGVRCELRAFADMFFATAWASFALTTRVAGTGLGMAKRASERSLSAARRRGAEATTRAMLKTKALAEGGRAHVEAGIDKLKTHNSSAVTRGAKDKVSEVMKSLDDAKRATLAGVKTLVDKGMNRGDGDANVDSRRSVKEKTRADATKPNAMVREEKKSGHATKEAKDASPKKSLHQTLNDLVPKETTKKIKEKLETIERTVENWPVVQSVKPRVKDFVHSVAERQRSIVNKLHSSTEGGVSTLRDARSNLVHCAREVKTHIAGGVHGVQGVAATGVTGAKQLISPLLRNRKLASRPRKVLSPEAPTVEVAPTVAESMNRDERKLMLTKEIKRADAMAPAYESELLAKPATIIVQPQDNLFDIASIAGISVMDLARYNNLRPDPRTRCLNLHPGQILYIPSRSLLDRLPAVDPAKEPRYELSVRVAKPPRSGAHAKATHSHRASSRAALDRDERGGESKFALSLAGSLGLAAAACALRGVRRAMDEADDNDDQ